MKVLENDWYGRGKTHIKVGQSIVKLPLITERSFPYEFRSAAKKLAETVANTISPKNRFKLQFKKGDDYYTDGKVITLSDAVLQENQNMYGLELFSALAAHEAAHIEWTDFKVWYSVKNPQVRTILNVLEDERIEMLISDHAPGYAYLMSKLKNWAGLKFKAHVESKGEFSLMPNIFAAIMFPSIIDRKLAATQEKVFEDVHKIVTPLGNSTAECLIQAENLYAYLKKLTEEEEEKEEGDSKGGEGGEGAGGSGDSQEQGSKESLQLEDLFGESSASENPSGEDPSSSPSKPTLEELEACLASLIETSYDAQSEKPTTLNIEEVIRGGDFIEAHSGVVFIKPKGNKAEYAKVKSEVTVMTGTLKKAIEYKREGHIKTAVGLRSGSLDVNKLTEAVQGVQNVYKNIEVKKALPLSVVVLIDESGSMWSNERFVHAKKAAILLNEALKSISGIEYFVYGHTADETYTGSVEIMVYKEKEYSNYIALSEVTARSNNRDGTAILETAKRVRKQTANKCLMIVISDGAPAANNYSGESAEAHTKEAALTVEKMGFTVLQVSIDGHVASKGMFKNCLQFKNIKELPKSMSNLIKKLV